MDHSAKTQNTNEPLQFGHLKIVAVAVLLVVFISWMKDPHLFAVLKYQNLNSNIRIALSGLLDRNSGSGDKLVQEVAQADHLDSEANKGQTGNLGVVLGTSTQSSSAYKNEARNNLLLLIDLASKVGTNLIQEGINNNIILKETDGHNSDEIKQKVIENTRQVPGADQGIVYDTRTEDNKEQNNLTETDLKNVVTKLSDAALSSIGSISKENTEISSVVKAEKGSAIKPIAAVQKKNIVQPRGAW